MAECFWDHERMIGVTEDCDEGGGGGGDLVSFWSTDGAFDDAIPGEYASYMLPGTYPAISPDAGAGSVAITGIFDVDYRDYIPEGMFEDSIFPGSTPPAGPFSLITPLPAAIGASEVATWDAPNSRWVFAMPSGANFPDSYGRTLVRVEVDGTPYVACLYYGGLG